MPVAVYRFGRFVLDPASFRLRRDGTDVPLTPKAFEVLALLVRERRRGLTKQELFDAVWPDTAVTENTLTQRIKELRQALGDSPQEPTYIRTIPRGWIPVRRRGYGRGGTRRATDSGAGQGTLRAHRTRGRS